MRNYMMMMKRFLLGTALCALLLNTGCSSSPKPKVNANPEGERYVLRVNTVPGTLDAKMDGEIRDMDIYVESFTNLELEYMLSRTSDSNAESWGYGMKKQCELVNARPASGTDTFTILYIGPRSFKTGQATLHYRAVLENQRITNNELVRSLISPDATIPDSLDFYIDGVNGPQSIKAVTGNAFPGYGIEYVNP